MGMHMLTAPSNGKGVDIAPTNDHVSDCTAAYAKNTTINTANLNFGYYLSPSALALQIINQDINTSTAMWPTTVTGGTSIPYNGNGLTGTMPSIYAQAYGAAGNVIHLLLTNKDSVSHAHQHLHRPHDAATPTRHRQPDRHTPALQRNERELDELEHRLDLQRFAFSSRHYSLPLRIFLPTVPALRLLVGAVIPYGDLPAALLLAQVRVHAAQLA
jgi:hypothetical protein